MNLIELEVCGDNEYKHKRCINEKRINGDLLYIFITVHIYCTNRQTYMCMCFVKMYLSL